jgi:transmembrane sensor
MENVTPMTDRRTIEAEAAAWIAQLDGARPSQEDLAALREWMGRSREHRAAMERLAATWDDLNILTQLAVPLPGRQVAGDRGYGGGFLGSVTRPVMAMVAGSVMVGAVLAGTWFWRNAAEAPGSADHASIATAPALQSRSYTTAVGMQRTIELSDGSRVLLNTDSEVEIELGAATRQIRLLRGEALFEVARDPDRPFLVYAGNGLVRAVGTAFSVYLRNENSVSVTVTEGEVELAAVPEPESQDSTRNTAPEPPAPLATLKAGQVATFGHKVESIQYLALNEIERQLSWRNGMLRFDGEPLSHVVEEVSRYTTQKIVILDPGLADLRIGGYFKVGETEAMFEALETSFGIHAERAGGNLVYLSAAP